MSYGTNVNNGEIVQGLGVISAINAQMSGGALTTVDISNYASTATTLLKAPKDALLNSMSVALGKTAFAVRDYTGAFNVVQKDSQEYGLITRKENYVDQGGSDSVEYGLVDGQAYNPYTYHAPKVIETRYYGAHAHDIVRSMPTTQLNMAFTSPEETARWFSAYNTHILNEKEVLTEADRRACVLNAIAGVNELNADKQVINLRTMYNAETGLALTNADLAKPENFVPFSKWMYARIKYYMDLLRIRSTVFHYNVSLGNISRHTTPENMVSIWNSRLLGEINASVLSGVFNTDYMKPFKHEEVPYWQALENPFDIKVTPAIIDASGSPKAGVEQTVTNVIGILCDKDFMGTTTVLESSQSTPLAGNYKFYNMSWCFTNRTFVDYTENALIFTLN